MATVVKIAGLYTQPNPLGSCPEGALLEAVNIIIDKNNIAEPRRGFALYGNAMGAKCKQLFSYKNRLLRHYDSKLQFDDGTGTFADFSGSYSELDAGLRLRGIESNGNFYFTSDTGIQKISAKLASEFTTAANYIRPAGGIKALNVVATIDYSVTGFFTQESKCAYRVVWAKKDANDNLILGTPSSSTSVTNVSTTQTGTVNLSFVIPNKITSATTEYYYQVYRTAVVARGTLPLSDVEVGDEMQLVIEDKPTAADFSRGYVLINDITPESYRKVGAFLYTNSVSGQGSSQTNDAPPIAKDITLYNNQVFFSNTRTGQKLDLDLIGLSGLVPGTSAIRITDGSITNQYVFNGATEKYNVTVGAKSATAPYSYFLMNSASNERKYYPWFDLDGLNVAPSATDTLGRMPVQVNISGINSSVKYFNGSTYTDNTDEAKTAAGTSFDLLVGVKDFDSVATTTTVGTVFIDRTNEAKDFGQKKASVIIQSLKYEAVLAGDDGNLITITYDNAGGALAASENLGTNAVTISFGGTTPTASQIITACSALTLVTVTLIGTDNIQTQPVAPTALTDGGAFPLFPTTPSTTEFLYVGHRTEKFIKIYVDIDSAKIGDAIIEANYFDGLVWKKIDIVDGTVNFTKSGTIDLSSLPTDWAQTDPGSGTTAYWLQFKILSGTYTSAPTANFIKIPIEDYTYIGNEETFEKINLDLGQNGIGGDPKFFDSVKYYNGLYTDRTDEAKTRRGIPFHFFALVGDYLYLGQETEKFNKLIVDLDTKGNLIDLVVEYYDSNTSLWTPLVISDGTSDLSQDGTISFTAPSTWGTFTVNTKDAYWVRMSTTTVAGATLPTCNLIKTSSDLWIHVQYYNGANWISLSNTDTTNSLTGDGLITYTAPLDWTKTIIDEQELYWVRFKRITGVFTTVPKADQILNINPASSDDVAEKLRIALGYVSDFVVVTEGEITNIATGVGSVDITSPAHGLSNGDTVLISLSNSTPSIDGSYLISGVTTDKFTIVATVGTVGTTGHWKQTNDIVHISNVKNGNTIHPRVGMTTPGAPFAINLVTLGDGEDKGYFDSVQYYNGATYTDLTSEARSGAGTPYTILRDPTVNPNDRFYVGKIDNQFDYIKFDLAVPAILAGTVLVIEYWNGTAWSVVTVTDGTVNLTSDGIITISVSNMPLNWSPNDPSGTGALPIAYWLRLKYVGGAVTTIPTGYFTISSEYPNVLLSSAPTASLQIDETSRSLVNVVNFNPFEIVYANYISTDDDVPGKMSFEARDITQLEFYITSNDAGTTGQLFNPKLLGYGDTSIVSTNEVSLNRLFWSKYQQPDAVPVLNFQDIGPKDKAILRILGVRDCLFILKEDGVYRLTGKNSQFTILPFDASVNLTAPDSAVVLNNQVYMLTNQGVSRLTDTGAPVVSRPIENLINKVTTPAFAFENISFAVAYETDRSYLLFLPTHASDTVATQAFRFNTFTNTWTNWDMAKTCGLVHLDKLYFGANDVNYIERERKDSDRADYADREYNLTIPANGINGTEITLNTSVNVKVGDMLIQKQRLTISRFNWVLKKLDLDDFVTDTDYFSSLEMEVGDEMGTKILLLAQKLNADAGIIAHGGITDYVTAIGGTGGSTFIDYQTKFNIIVNALNIDVGVFLSNYKLSTGITNHEAQVIGKDLHSGKLTVRYPTRFVEGAVTSYAHIESKISFQPPMFAEPMLLKQVAESTIMMQDTAFTDAEISYRTDLDRGFEITYVSGSGSGVWGEFIWSKIAWGGLGNEAPFRVLIPRAKQRCRYIEGRFVHKMAHEHYRLLGISFAPPRAYSTRAYR